MRIFLSFNNFDIRQIILCGYQDLNLNWDWWNELEKNAHTINVKAMNVLYCALNETEFNSIPLRETQRKYEISL